MLQNPTREEVLSSQPSDEIVPFACHGYLASGNRPLAAQSFPEGLENLTSHGFRSYAIANQERRVCIFICLPYLPRDLEYRASVNPLTFPPQFYWQDTRQSLLLFGRLATKIPLSC